MSEGNYSDQPRNSGGGCATKFIVIVGIGVTIIGIAVCGGIAFMANKFKDAVTQDPDKIEKISQAIVEVDVPEDVRPAFGIDMDMFGNEFSMAIYGNADGSSMWVMEIPSEYNAATADVDNVMREMEQQQQHKPAEQKQKTIEIEEREDIEKDVNGSLGKFMVARGKDEAGVDHVQVMGVFETKSKKHGMFNLVIAEENMDMEGGKKLIESVK